MEPMVESAMTSLPEEPTQIALAKVELADRLIVAAVQAGQAVARRLRGR